MDRLDQFLRLQSQSLVLMHRLKEKPWPSYSVLRNFTGTYGTENLLYTDHKPQMVIFGFAKGISVMTASCLQCRAFIPMGYTFDIQFKGMKEITYADSLSHLPGGPDSEFNTAGQDGAFDVSSHEILVVQDHQMSMLPMTAEDIAKATLQTASWQRWSNVLNMDG